MNDEKTTFVNTQVPVTLDKKLREIAAQKRTSRSDVVREAIETFIASEYDRIFHDGEAIQRPILPPPPPTQLQS